MVEMNPGIAGQQAQITKYLSKAYQNGWIKTIEDLERATYGFSRSQYMNKSDAPVITTTTGYKNRITGANLWYQVQYQANALTAVGFKPWNYSGYKALTAAAATTTAGIAEAGAIPDTIKPTVVDLAIDPTESALSTDYSSIQAKIAPKEDSIPWAAQVEWLGTEFKNRINRSFLATNDTVKTVGILSLDTVIASYAEIAYGKVADNAVLDAGDVDIYGLDRDAAASWTDAYVNGQAFGSGARDLQLSHIDAMFTNCAPYWDTSSGYNNKVMITGYDTLERMQQILQSQQRFEVPTRASFSVNGIKTVSGAEAGFAIASYKGVPIIPDANTLQDTISRIYLVDQDNLHTAVLQPPTYLESSDYQALDKFATEGVYYMEAEVVCTNFKAQGKVRDLK